MPAGAQGAPGTATSMAQAGRHEQDSLDVPFKPKGTPEKGLHYFGNVSRSGSSSPLGSFIPNNRDRIQVTEGTPSAYMLHATPRFARALTCERGPAECVRMFARAAVAGVFLRVPLCRGNYRMGEEGSAKPAYIRGHDIQTLVFTP